MILIYNDRILFCFMLPNMSSQGVLVSEPHRAFLTSKLLFLRVNLEVNLDISHMFEAELALPLSQACVTLPVVAQTFLEREKMFGTAGLGTYQLPVRSKQAETLSSINILILIKNENTTTTTGR